MLRHVRNGQMTPTELAVWLRRAMMSDRQPMSDNEKSAIACALALMLLEGNLDLEARSLEELVDRSAEAGAIARLI